MSDALRPPVALCGNVKRYGPVLSAAGGCYLHAAAVFHAIGLALALTTLPFLMKLERIAFALGGISGYLGGDRSAASPNRGCWTGWRAGAETNMSGTVVWRPEREHWSRLEICRIDLYPTRRSPCLHAGNSAVPLP